MVLSTTHFSDVMDVIVLTLSVSVCVCYHSHGRTNRHTDLNCMEVKWKDISVKFCRSRSKFKAMRSKSVHWDIPLTSESHVYRPAKEETQEYHW